jgi:hypothetical protein
MGGKLGKVDPPGAARAAGSRICQGDWKMGEALIE